MAYSPVYDEKNNITGYNVTDPNGVSKFVSNTPPQQDSTIAGSPVRRYGESANTPGATGAAGGQALNGPGSTLDRIAGYYAGLDTNQPDEATIRAQMRSQVQGQIDAINNELAATLAQDAITGQDSLGRTRSTAARSGTLGSDFGNASLDRTSQANDRIVAADRAMAASRIADILSGVNTRADTKIANDKALAQKNSESYINYLTGVANSSREDVKTLAQSGHSYDALTPDQRTKLLDQTGYTDEQLKGAFLLNKPKADVLQSGVNGSQFYQISRDPITGKITSSSFDLGFTVPQGYNSQVLDTGQVIFTPKDWNGDPTKIITYGTPSALYNAKVNATNAAAAKDRATANGDLSPTDLKNLNASGVPTDVAHGIYKDAGNGYSDSQIKSNLVQTFGPELGNQYWTGFGQVMRKSASANAALLNLLGVSGG